MIKLLFSNVISANAQYAIEIKKYINNLQCSLEALNHEP